MVATVDLRQRQWLLAVAVSGSAREKERKMQRKGEGEWRGQGKTGLKFGFHAPRARWRAAGAPRATRCERSIAAAIQISNTTSNVQLQLHFPPIITPKQIDYLINRLHRYVELRVYYNIA